MVAHESLTSHPIWAADVVSSHCTLCGGTSDESAGARVDGIAFIECRSCGLVRADRAPSPDKVIELYRGDYFGEGSAPDSYRAYQDYSRSHALDVDPRRPEFRLVSPFLAPGSPVLEIGCAGGELLEVFRRKGYECFGVELNPAMAAKTRRRLAVPVIESSFEAGLEVVDRYFGAILACSVIEHTPRPREFLDEIARLLAPGGVALIVTPNWACAPRTGTEWVGWHGQFEHLSYFSARTLRNEFEARGLETEFEGSAGPPARIRTNAQKTAKRLRKRLRSLAMLGPALTRLKRRIVPPVFRAPTLELADHVGLYCKRQ